MDHRWFLICKSTVDKSIQIVVPASLRKQILHLAHHTSVAGYPGQRRMYNSLCCQFFWPHMAIHVSETIGKCLCCAKNESRFKHESHCKLIPAVELLDLVTIDILGPSPRTGQGNQLARMITDRYSTPMRSIPTSKKFSPRITNVFLDHWIIAFGIQSYLLMNDRPQFVGTFFASICTYYGVKNLANTAYHRQRNGQAKRYKCTINTRLHHYVIEQQRKLGIICPTAHLSSRHSNPQ